MGSLCFGCGFLTTLFFAASVLAQVSDQTQNVNVLLVMCVSREIGAHVDRLAVWVPLAGTCSLALWLGRLLW